MAVRTEDHGPVRVVVLDRPERRNAVDRPHAEALAGAFRELDADPAVAVGVLWGAGGTFCAGADLKAVAEGRPNRLAPDGDGPMGPSRMVLDTPVIAAIEGHAVAGGLELACWADLRVVAEDAVLGVFCRRWGVPLIDGGTARLPALIGLSHALDLILTGRPVDAAGAQRLGLANRVVPPGETKQAAVALGTQLAAFPQACLRADRRSALRGLGMPLDEALAAEFAGGLACLDAEGVPGAARFAAGAGRHGSFED